MLAGVNKLVVKGKDRLMSAIENETRPIITVANHRCNVDDPLMWSESLLFFPSRERLENE